MAAGQENAELVKVGYYGSYARGSWGVGSDLDVVIRVRRSDRPFAQRALDFDVTVLPVPADVLVYTEEEWQALRPAESRHAANLHRETVWVWERRSKD